jgi:hypothetical protein
VNPNQPSGGPGPARQVSARWTDSSKGDRVFVSSNPSTRPRTRQAGDLFQPVTSSQPPAAAVTDRLATPITPINGLNHGGELPAAPAPQSGYALGARRWVGRAAGLVVGTQGAVIALVGSAALVLVVGGMTMSATSSHTESAVAGPAPGRLPASAVPAVSAEQPVTASPIDAPAESARQAPATVYYSPSPPPVPAHQQPSPPANRVVPARLAPLPAPDHEPVLPPPSSPPPSTVTTDNAGYWTITTGSRAEETEPPTIGTKPCNCDVAKREIHNQGDRSTEVDRRREYRAQRAEYRSTSGAREYRVSEDRKQERQAVRPGATTAPRPSPNREP